jgi:hypothetical protein
MKNIYFKTLFSAVLAVASTLLMAGTAHAVIGPAGCGLGNQLMGGRDNQIVVATLNVIGFQTVGITLGTSNCVDSKGMAKLEAFVEANQVALANDMARGNGETLAGLTHVLGCTNAEEAQQTLHDNFGEIFAEESPKAISNGIRKTLTGQSAAGFSCLRLS